MISGGARVLLLGGTGFLGGHTARALAAAGHSVSILSRGSRAPVDGIESLKADRGDPEALAGVLEGRRFDFTVDFAAYDAGDIEKLLLVPYAALGRYVLISSGQVYLVTQSERVPYREEESESPLAPEPPDGTPDHGQWTYGVGKRRAEGALLALRVSHGVRGVILRLPVIVGEGDPRLRLWAYLERMLDGNPILLPDGGRQLTRHLYVGDVARVLLELLHGEGTRQAVYNLAQSDMPSLRELLEKIARLAGLEPRFVEASWAEIEEAGIERSFSPFSGRWVSVLDPARAAGEWSFLGTRTDEYLPAVVRWYLEHRPERSHPGYAQRPLEVRLASQLAAAAG